MLWVQDELSFDRFHENSENIYRVLTRARYTDKERSNPGTSLTQPLSMVLTESFPRKYFRNNNPKDQTVQFMGQNFMIRGIIKDIPENSHIQFDLLCSTIGEPSVQNYDNDWVSDLYYTYVLLRKDSEAADLNHKIT